MDFSLETYYPIFIYLGLVLAFAAANLVITHAPYIKPKKDTPVKLMPYESGMDPVGDARQRFDVKFYLIAILFLVFDVELLFLYPWAVAVYHPATGPLIPEPFHNLVFWSVQAFILLLVVGFVYDWRKGVFRWR